MAKSPTHLAQEISARRVALYHSDAVEALRLYYTPGNPQFLTRFFGKSLAEISVERDDRLQETDFRSSLAVLAQIEATFRVDYRNRCETGRKDSLSKVSDWCTRRGD